VSDIIAFDTRHTIFAASSVDGAHTLNLDSIEPGRYALQLTASANGLSSAPRSLTFTIVNH